MKPGPGAISGTISGTVLGPSGRPLPGARVYLARAPGPVPDVAVLTGTDGRFVLAAAPPGRYEVAASTDAHGTVTAEVNVGSAGATVTLRFGP